MALRIYLLERYPHDCCQLNCNKSWLFIYRSHSLLSNRLNFLSVSTFLSISSGLSCFVINTPICRNNRTSWLSNWFHTTRAISVATSGRILYLSDVHNMGETCYRYTCKLRIFCNISDLKNNCLCQILFSLSVSFHICFYKPSRGTDLKVNDVIKSSETPRGEEMGDHVQCLVLVTVGLMLCLGSSAW